MNWHITYIILLIINSVLFGVNLGFYLITKNPNNAAALVATAVIVTVLAFLIIGRLS